MEFLGSSARNSLGDARSRSSEPPPSRRAPQQITAIGREAPAAPRAPGSSACRFARFVIGRIAGIRISRGAPQAGNQAAGPDRDHLVWRATPTSKLAASGSAEASLLGVPSGVDRSRPRLPGAS